MKAPALGIWDIADEALRLIGRSAAWSVRRKLSREQEYAYALIGGALVCTVFGAAVGFAISHVPREAAIDGVILGGLLGLCVGMFLGACVEAVDGSIQRALRSLRNAQSLDASIAALREAAESAACTRLNAATL